MYSLSYDSGGVTPVDIAKELGLEINDKPGPYIQFYLKDKPVGYLVKAGLIVLAEGIIEKIIKTRENK